MDEKSDELRVLEERLRPPHGKTRTILNSAFNGMTIGVGVPIFYKVILDLPNGKLGAHLLNPKQHLSGWSIAFAACSTAIGALYGLHEAKRIEEYRDNIAGEILKLRGEVNRNTDEVNHNTDLVRGWEKKEKTREAQTPATSETTRG